MTAARPLDWTAELKVGERATLWSNAWMFASGNDTDGVTEYGILEPGRPTANPMLLSSYVVAAHVLHDEVRGAGLGVDRLLGGDVDPAEEAGRLDLPICVHSATGSFAVHDYFLDECGFNKFKLAVVGSFHSLIFNKVPERFPQTKWAFIEVSSQWIPYAIHDYARRFERSGAKVDKSDVLRRSRIWVACQTDDDLP